MVRQVTLDEAQEHLLELIEAALSGDEVIIVRDEGQAIKLVAVEAPRPPRQFGSARGLIEMADDFDAPLDDFKAYVE
jgi:antitoxin (DNA-binding transcriptional repressor) of toxin-antitoxin stability system